MNEVNEASPASETSDVERVVVLRPNDDRYVAELPSGIIKKPKLEIAGENLYTNDVVLFKDGKVFPMYGGDENDVYGIAAANCNKGGKALIAT